jgi:serine/threonine-protein kinase
LITGVVSATAAVTVVAMQLLGAGSSKAGAGSSTPTAGGPIRLSIALPPGEEVTDTNLLPLAISPDGSRIVYVGLRGGGRILFLRNLAHGDAVPMAGSEGGRMPFFSPDGEWIGFFTNTHLKKIAVASGAVQTSTRISAEPRGGVWAPDGTIYYAPHNVASLWKIPAAGGAPAEVTTLDRASGEITTAGRRCCPMVRCCSRRGPVPDLTSGCSSCTIRRPAFDECWPRPSATRREPWRRAI